MLKAKAAYGKEVLEQMAVANEELKKKQEEENFKESKRFQRTSYEEKKNVSKEMSC